jgi:integrase
MERIPNTRVAASGIIEVQLLVPRQYQSLFRVKTYIRSTGTSDPRVARKERDRIVAEFEAKKRQATAEMPAPMIWKLAHPPRSVTISGLSFDVAEHIIALVRAEHPETLPSMGGGFGRVPVQVPADHHGPVYLKPTGEVVESLVEMPVAGCTFSALVELWAKERSKGIKAIGQQTGKMDRLARLLGHDDATRVSARDLQRYKESLVDDVHAGRIGSTTAADHIDMLRMMFSFGWDNHKLDESKPNPAERLKWTMPKDDKAEVLDFTAQERALIIRSALGSDDPVIKWANLLAGYSGARLAEIIEAQTQDIYEEDGIWILHIRLDNRPSGQQIKNGFSKRRIVIHSAVLAAGFLDYVASLSPGPLFPMCKIHEERLNTYASKSIMRWLRDIGIQDQDPKHLRRFHSWRHTVTTILENTKRVSDARNRYIIGHAPADKHAGYLHHSAAELRAAIELIPTIDPTLTPRADTLAA